MAFNLIDTYFVGQLGTKFLAAMSFTFPVVMVVAGVSVGLGIGASTAISKAIGEGDDNKVKRLTTDSLLLSIIIVAILIAIGMLTIRPLFSAIGADDGLIDLIYDYMKFWYPGMIFLVIPMVGNNAIRATGDTKVPSAIMIFSVIVNVILDPIFIFGWGPVPRMELEGAAIATVISRAFTLFFSLFWLSYKYKMISVQIPSYSVISGSWRRVLAVGIPTAGTNIIVPFAVGLLTRLIASYGTAAVAAFGVASRIEIFAMSVMMALSSVLSPFLGQNFGAGKLHRVREGIKISQVFGVVWSLLIIAILLLFGGNLVSAFDSNPEVVEIGITYFSIIPFGYALQSVFRMCQVSFTVLNRPFVSAFLMILQMLILYIPLAYLGSFVLGLPGIFGSYVISNLISMIIAFSWLNGYLSKLESATD